MLAKKILQSCGFEVGTFRAFATVTAALGLVLTGATTATHAAGIDEGTTTITLKADGDQRFVGGRMVRPARPSGSAEEHQRRIDGAEASKALATAPAISRPDQVRAAAEPSPLATCQNNAQSRKVLGWVIDHFSYCHVRSYVYTRKICTNGKCVVYVARFRVTTNGRSVMGARKMQFVTHVDDWQIDPVLAGTPLTIDMVCDPCTRGSSTKPVTKSFSKWALDGRANKTNSWVVASPASSGSGVHKVQSYVFNQYLKTPGTTPIYVYQNDFRCDSAQYLTPKLGCSFHRTALNWYLYVEGSNYKPVAIHIRDAQRKTGIPGSLEKGDPLTYQLEADDFAGYVKANRAAAKKACAELKRKKGQECDEYPMAATRQGADTGRFSVRMVSRTSNRSAGGVFSAWIRTQRVMTNDAFFVVVLTKRGQR